MKFDKLAWNKWNMKLSFHLQGRLYNFMTPVKLIVHDMQIWSSQKVRRAAAMLSSYETRVTHKITQFSFNL